MRIDHHTRGESSKKKLPYFLVSTTTQRGVITQEIKLIRANL